MPEPESTLQQRLAEALKGQYVLERLLGQGGMGTVFLARDATLDRPVAIKVISPDVTGSAEIRQRFLLEARMVARLRHPNIVSVYAAGESDGLLWFAMEFVPGESLRERMQREPKLAPEMVAAVVHDLSLALDDAHAAGIVHRDVKPENILLDGETGRAMLMDFGVARALSAEDSGLTGAGFVLGSPRYMSPEQATGEPTIDGRSDLYSLGLVAYEMLAGRPAVTGDTPASILVKHLTVTPTPLRELLPDVPEALETVIARSLEKQPDDRFARGRMLAAVLEGRDPEDPETDTLSTSARARATARASAAGGTKSTHNGKGRGFNRLVLGAGAVAVVAGVAAIFLRGGGEADNSREWLVAPFEVQTSDASLAWLREGAVNMLGLTLSQWEDLHIVDYERTLDLLQAEQGDDQRVGLEVAQRVARRAAAGTVILGQVTTVNNSLFVVARRYDVKSGKRIDEATATVSLDGDPRVAFEEIAKQLLDLAGGPALTMELAKQTTASVEAYRLYLDGITALNRWQLTRADSLLAEAVQLDSTFALAHYKRSLGLGWSNLIDSAYIDAVDKAVQFSDRLPASQREILTANRDLAYGFQSATQGDLEGARRSWLLAQSRLTARVAIDSTDAEAWYGMADAAFHAGSSTGLASIDSISMLLTASLRGFEKAIALDSTFHLAYSHLVSLYQIGASAQSGALIDGDSILPRAAVTDTSRQSLLVRLAQERTIQFAQGWVQQDPSAAQAWQSLSDSYAVMARLDSAHATLGRVRAMPSGYTPTMAYQRAVYSMMLGETQRALTDLREALLRFPADSLTAPTDVFLPLTGLMVAGAAGKPSLLDSLKRYAVAVRSTLPFVMVPTQTMADFFGEGMAIAMGLPASPLRIAAIRKGQRALDAVPVAQAGPILSQAASVLYVAFLATNDSTFANAAAQWSTAGRARFQELDAIIALNKGDSAKARALASEFATPAVLAKARLSFAGLRVMTQADVRKRLGDLRGAVDTYNAISPTSFSLFVGEPGMAMYSRSFLERARLQQALGERDSAIASYEQFVARWGDSEGPLRSQLDEANTAITRLRDQPKGTNIPGGTDG